MKHIQKATALCLLTMIGLWGGLKDAAAGELLISIHNIKKPGELNIAMYKDKKSYEALMKGKLDMGEKTELNFKEKVKEGSVRYSFDVPDGKYGIIVYVDANLNQKLDRSVFGMPTEQFGFSNNAKGAFGPPKYKDIMFDISGGTELSIDLI